MKKMKVDGKKYGNFKFSIIFSLAATFLAVLSAQTTVQNGVSQSEAPLLRSSAADSDQYDTSGGAVKFEFKFKDGDNSRILSHVDEDVFFNRRLSHHAEILNRISTKVTQVNEDGSAVQDGIFMTSENSVGRGAYSTFTWGEEYKSVFTRGTNGVYDITDEYFMPTVRDVPVFPDRAVSPGESWTAEGHEAHDLRRQFAMETPFKVPFTAFYTYLGTVENTSDAAKEGKAAAKLNVINVKYTMYMETPTPEGAAAYSDYPAQMNGYSDELIYWDAERGTIDHYTENFRIVMLSSYGNVYEFRGSAKAEVTEFERIATEEKVAEIEDIVKDLGISDVTVKKSDKGLTISIENIQFLAESAKLVESEMRKVQKIAKILEAYPDNDILVTGHTAHFPGGADPQVLSEERAQSVANCLIQMGVRDQKHIFTKGFGDTQPIDSNDTFEGRARNRRVEITILDE